jgi:hypothetical protein
LYGEVSMVEFLAMSTRATLLAVDDEPDVLAIVVQFAQRFGFTVVMGLTCSAPSATSTPRARSF